MAPQDLVGRVLDRYRLLELLGAGGMGAVYLAEHERIQKKVALKVLHPHLAEAYPQSVTRMLNEARAATAVGHPAIVEVLDYGDTSDGYHYLVMELLDGRPLSDLLEAEGRLGLQTSLALLAPVLGALQAAHDKGIVHRDLKPENIFVHRLRIGGYGVKLLDFGISKFTLDQDARLTATGAILGTPAYMSLEQVEGRTDVDHRTDIYAAGAILYQCLSGHLPYEGDNPNQIMAAILREQPTPLAAHRPDLPQELQEAVMRALARDRQTRFATSAEFWAALARFFDPQSPEPAQVLSRFLPVGSPDTRLLATLAPAGRQAPGPPSPVPPGVATGHPAPVPDPPPPPPAVATGAPRAPTQARATRPARRRTAGIVAFVLVLLLAVAGLALGIRKCGSTKREAAPRSPRPSARVSPRKKPGRRRRSRTRLPRALRRLRRILR